jgi:hypothetical protein
MNKLWKWSFVIGLIFGFTLCTAGVKSAALSQGKVMREYRGITLDMKQADVQTKLGKPSQSSASADEYKLEGEDMMTVRYENGVVTAIQLLLFDAKKAPPFNEVIGDAQIEENDSGRKLARKVLDTEKFWVSMSQNKDATMTTITIKKM